MGQLDNPNYEEILNIVRQLGKIDTKHSTAESAESRKRAAEDDQYSSFSARLCEPLRWILLISAVLI
jgi:hypothetical protein